MTRGILLTAAFLSALAPVSTLAVDDQSLLDRTLLKQVRPLAVNTTIVEQGEPQARLVTPTTEPWLAAAKCLQSEIETITGVQLPIVADSDLTHNEWHSGNLIVIGNLLASPAYARLYHNFFVCADAGYTGTEGFELRTVHEPFGPGTNVVALGAQAAVGLTRGTDRLLALIKQHGRKGQLVLPRLLELDLKRPGARAPVAKKLSESDIAHGKEFHDNVYARTGTERSAAHRVARDAMRYHRTGDEGYLALYRYGIMSHINYYRENEYIQTGGLGRYDRDFRDSWTWTFIVTWDLLEEHPTWTDDERLLITNHILRCLLECNVYQHWTSKASIESWRNFNSITHNHHTWPGLANLFGGWYFRRHYQHPMADDWLTIANGMFRGCRHSSKPWEDSAGYQWIPLRHVLTYSFASGDTTFIDEGHAGRAGQTVLMCIDSLGHQPAFGDHGSFLAASALPEILSQLEYANRDGRYRWALDRLEATSGAELEEAYYTDAKPKRPDELTGLNVSYLPRPHFDLNGRNAQYFPRANVSFEESFDKLTLRAGWKPNDDYLMLDGYSGGSHGHQDCNAIIGYTAAGAHWLVDAEYIRQTPKYHCAVTVVRDGVAIRNPAMARLDDVVQYEDSAICRTTIPDYNGLRWTRHIFWVPNQFVAAIDELTAVKPGDYSLSCCWRVYGQSTLDGNTLTLRQGDARFTLQNLSGDNLELVHIKDLANLPIQHLYQRRSAQLEKGQRICFLNVFGAGTADEPPFSASLAGERRVAILAGNDTWIAGAGPLETGDIHLDAQAWLADTSGVRLASAKSCTHGDQNLWHSDKPCALHICGKNAATGTAGKTPQPGQRPVLTVKSPNAEQLDPPLKLDLAQLGHSTEPQPQTTPTSLENARPLTVSWCFDDFPRTPKPLEIAAVRTNPDPHKSYQPAERLIDSRYSNSTNSCLFPAGKNVTIDLELHETRTITEVRIRAWEMNEGWQTKSRKLQVSTDGQTWKPVPGDFEVIGTQRWGGNVNTIYAQPVAREARFLRITAKPASDKSSVYFAEIEVLGTDEGQPPSLTAIATVDLDSDGTKETVVATGAGHILALDAAGHQRWQTNIGARITTLAAITLPGDASQSVIYGAAPNLLGLIGPDGKKLKEINIPQYRGIASEPQNLTVADLDGNGIPSIVVGAKSWQYLAYSPELELQWSNVIYAHSATVAEVADLDADGTKETVAGNAYFCLNIINSNGKRRLRAGRFGPEQSAVTSADLNDDGRREVILGTDGGDVLAFDLDGKQLWQRNVGDRVTSLVPMNTEGTTTIIAASDSGYVWAFDGNGKPRWHTNLGQPVRRLIPRDDTLIAAASAAGVVVLSQSGTVIAAATTPAPVVDLVLQPIHCTAQLANGSLCAIPLER